MTCREEHCITCGDIAVPMLVTEACDDGTAVCVDDTESAHTVATELLCSVTRGDQILVHAGVAIQNLGAAA
jgi:hydrogenase maturation factor